MPILTHNMTIIDYDLHQLRQYFTFLDVALKPLVQRTSDSRLGDRFADYIARDSLPFEQAEYLIGSGLVAAQRYLSTARCSLAMDQTTAFATRPFWTDGITFAQALHDGANYWKHHQEWRLDLHKDGDLKAQAERSLLRLERIPPWADYTCSNLLFALTQDRNLKLSNLLPNLEIWRDTLLAMI